jgi:hypothetical protein
MLTNFFTVGAYLYYARRERRQSTRISNPTKRTLRKPAERLWAGRLTSGCSCRAIARPNRPLVESGIGTWALRSLPSRQKECLVRVDFPPPTRHMRTVSLSADRPAPAQEFRYFRRPAVHLWAGPEARNLSLTPGFLCGCSLGPFGTHPKTSAQIKSLGRLASVAGFEPSLGRPRSRIKPRRELCREAMAKGSVVWTSARTAPRGVM